ncbi:MAG: fenitrothion hydrolase [Solirubrobacterales bacterium]
MAPGSRRRRPGAAAGAALTGLGTAALAFPAVAGAHGALVGKQDLPIPEWLFAWGASLVLIASFVALTIAWREARFEGERWRPVSVRLSALLVNRVTAFLAGALSVFLLGLVVYAGLEGTESPDRNFALTFIFSTFWLGLVVASALLGDVFRALNPWRAIARTVAGLFTLVARQSPPAPLRYPERLGRWPAVAGIAAFAWFELVYALSGFQAVGLTPHSVAVATLLYSGITFVGMSLFGIEKWLERGEAFSVHFNMFSRLSPLEVRDGRLGRRGWLTATTGWATVPGSVALVLLVIGVTAFDGASEGFLAEPIKSLADAVDGLGALASVRLANTAYMLATVGAVAAIFWAGVAGMHTVRDRSGEHSTRELAGRFAHGFIPIALAYLVAHYFSFFVFLEQAQFTFLLSDPLGDGSNLFGTADSGIDYGLLSSNFVWYVQVGALVVGHVLALVLGHDRALSTYGDARSAARSQYWMLAMMVGFTTLGLFLLSVSNA